MSEKYLDNNGTQILINQIKGNCTQKRSTLPIASVDELGNTYQYTGTTIGSLVHGYFYECVSDGQDPATYSWQNVNVQPTAGTPTASSTTFDNTTSGLQATNVQDAIDEVDGIVDSAVSDVSTLQTDVSNIQGVIPSTTTTTNKLVDHDSLGTAAFKDFTPNVAPNNHNLVESNAVYNAITTALTSIYTPRGDLSCAELTSSLLVAANVGNIYEMSDSGTTSALFLQGAGKTIHVGDNVGIIQTGVSEYKFNLMANAFDMTDYQKKELTSAVEGETTVEGALGALSTNNQATQTEVNDVVNVLGAKNRAETLSLAEFAEVSGGTISGNTVTYRGVTFTFNDDKTITVNGTTGSSAIAIRVSKNLTGLTNIILSGCPSGGSASGYQLQLHDRTSGDYPIGDYDNGRLLTLDPTHIYEVMIVIRSNITVDNLTYKPMIRLASDPDNTYQPYAMTNQQITPYVQAISNPNLLDNPWFTVNQRGNTFYQTENGYCVDRWILGKGAFTARETNAPYGVLQTRVANTNGWLRQKTEFGLDTTKPITYSAIISASVTSDYGFALKFSNMDDYNDSKMKWFPTTANQKVLVHFTDLPFKHTAFEVVANAGASSTVKIYALKVELGTVSTLAMDCAPNYTTELEKCKRFFEKNSWVSWVPCKAVTNGSMMYGFTYRFDVQKRIANWNMTVDSTKGNSNGFLYDLTTGTTIPNAEIVISNSGSYNSRMVQIKITHSSIVAGHEYRYAIGDNVFEISADI